MIRKIFSLILLPFVLFAKEGGYIDTSAGPTPWFTGPLVAPPANLVFPGYYNIETYLYAYAYTAQYGNDWKAREAPTYWSLNGQVIVELGILNWFDIVLIPNVYWNYRSGSANWEMGDSSAIVNFQIYRDELPHKNWLPSIKLSFKEVFPIGKYQNLNRQKTDLGGTGSYVSCVDLIFSKLFHIRDFHFLDIRLALALNFPAPVEVKKLNYYGGSLETKGTVHPGISGGVDFAFEYSLSRHWVFALDLIGQWSAKTHFTSKNGKPLGGESASGGLLPLVQYSLAPALEYNFTEHLGIIFGSWFTIAGKNANKFSNATIAINISSY